MSSPSLSLTHTHAHTHTHTHTHTHIRWTLKTNLRYRWRRPCLSSHVRSLYRASTPPSCPWLISKLDYFRCLSRFLGQNSSLFLRKKQNSSVGARQAVNKLRLFVPTREKVSNRHEAMCRMMSEVKFASDFCFRSSLALIGWFRLWKSPLIITSPPRWENPPGGRQVPWCCSPISSVSCLSHLNIHHLQLKTESWPKKGELYFSIE